MLFRDGCVVWIIYWYNYDWNRLELLLFSLCVQKGECRKFAFIFEVELGIYSCPTYFWVIKMLAVHSTVIIFNINRSITSHLIQASSLFLLVIWILRRCPPFFLLLYVDVWFIHSISQCIIMRLLFDHFEPSTTD